MDTIAGQKQYLRKKILNLLSKLSEKKFLEAGEIVAHKHIAPWLDATFTNSSGMEVGLFFSLKNEISTLFLDEILKIRKCKRYIPGLLPPLNTPKFFPLKKNGGILQKSFINGIYMPALLAEMMKNHGEISLAFIPGLMFDLYGNRLGRGKGYYDRYFSSLPCGQKPLCVALALDEQIVEKVPVESHDFKMDFLCTPNMGMKKIKD